MTDALFSFNDILMIVTAAPDVYLVGFALHLPVGVWDAEGYMMGWLGTSVSLLLPEPEQCRNALKQDEL